MEDNGRYQVLMSWIITIAVTALLVGMGYVALEYL